MRDLDLETFAKRRDDSLADAECSLVYRVHLWRALGRALELEPYLDVTAAHRVVAGLTEEALANWRRGPRYFAEL